MTKDICSKVMEMWIYKLLADTVLLDSWMCDSLSQNIFSSEAQNNTPTLSAWSFPCPIVIKIGKDQLYETSLKILSSDLVFDHYSLTV